MQDFLDAFPFIADHRSLLWHKSLEHLSLSFEAIAIALVIAVPIGVWLGHLHRGSFVAINASNIGRALPSLAVIAIFLAITGIGRTTVIIALVILAVPPVITNAYVGVDGVDRDAVESARGMGMRPLQVLFGVELPLALPLIFAGIRTAAVYVVATATLAGIFGGGGLGDIIADQATYRLSGVLAAAMLVTALAFLVEGLFAALQWAVTPRGLRHRRPAEIGPVLETA
jgi:osmoprotectant transport system permease protein